MILQRAALLAAGPLAALGLATGLAHADDTLDLFSGDGISITEPALTGTATEVGGLPPIDAAYEYMNQILDVTYADFSAPMTNADVYLTTDLFGGSETLVDLTPGAAIADSDIFSTFSFANGSVLLEHAYVGSTDTLAGLSDIGSYNALVLDGTTFALPESLSNFLGPEFGLTALDVAILSAQAPDMAAALDLTPFLDLLTSLSLS